MRKCVLYTNTISPHQTPLAKEIASIVGLDNFRYVYTQRLDCDHNVLGWEQNERKWCMHVDAASAQECLETADILLSGLRDFDLFERRAAKRLHNFYMTERWLKPPIGLFRFLHPRYYGYARRLSKLLDSHAVWGLPIGIYAACDIARICGLMHGDLKCLFRTPKLGFERKPGGMIFSKNVEHAKRYCLADMMLWGYFVERSNLRIMKPSNPFSILWVGRFLDWKCVDTIIQAVAELVSLNKSYGSKQYSLILDLYGTGPAEHRLKKNAEKYGDTIHFHPPVPIGEVRKLMREHDVYVLSSNSYEGWGAVVSEALEEGMKVFGTYEAGSCATMLSESDLFHVGDWRRLTQLLVQYAEGLNNVKCSGVRKSKIGDWNARYAAAALLALAK